MKKLLTLTDLRDDYGIPRTTAYRLFASGQLKAVKLNGRTLVDAESAEALRKSLPAFEPKAYMRDAKVNG